MKKISSLLIAGTFALLASTSFATSTTSLDSDWTCTTNASSSDVEKDKAADKQMSETATSAKDAYALAAENCRDCTKITCETKDK